MTTIASDPYSLTELIGPVEELGPLRHSGSIEKPDLYFAIQERIYKGSQPPVEHFRFARHFYFENRYDPGKIKGTPNIVAFTDRDVADEYLELFQGCMGEPKVIETTLLDLMEHAREELQSGVAIVTDFGKDDFKVIPT